MTMNDDRRERTQSVYSTEQDPQCRFTDNMGTISYNLIQLAYVQIQLPTNAFPPTKNIIPWKTVWTDEI